jgi:hypothetical protein
MTPYEEAKAVWAKERCVRSFEEDLRWHLLNGYVFSRPDFFIMGRHVNSKAEPGLIVNPSYLFHPEDCDAWMIYLMAGDCKAAFGILPFELPLVCFERGNDLRFYPLSSFRRLSGAT